MTKRLANQELFEYAALAYSQRGEGKGPGFIIFHAPAADIIKWADVDRLEEDNTKGAQRPLRALKVRKVADFLNDNPKNTIPTAVIVALDMDHANFIGEEGVGKLKITCSKKSKPGLIIDGQHRVFGAASFSGTTRLNVIALSGADDAERAFQFVVINNTPTRVSKDHIKALNLQFNESDLNKRLMDSASLGLREGTFDDLKIVDSKEPFRGLLSFPTNAAGFIPANAIEGALAETRERAAYLGVQDLERDFFLQIWKRIKDLRKEYWKKSTQKEPQHLLQKATIHALTTYILDNLETVRRMSDDSIDFTEEETLFKYVDKMIERIPGEFWSTQWSASGLDTDAGRQRLLEALKMIDLNARNKSTWYDKVSLIDPAVLAGQTYGPKHKPKRKEGKLK